VLRNNKSTDRANDQIDVITAAKKYLDVVTGGNIENATSIAEWYNIIKSIDGQYGSGK